MKNEKNFKIKKNLENWLIDQEEFDNLSNVLFQKNFIVVKKTDIKTIYKNLVQLLDIKNINLINSKNLEELLKINEDNKNDILEFFDFQWYLKNIFEIIFSLI